MDNSELCIPAAALEASSEDGQPMAPQEGDPVEFTLSGTVTRSEGGNLYVKPDSVNGQPIAGEGAGEMEEPAEEGAPDMAGEDEAMAEDMRKNNYGGLAVLLFFLLFGLKASAAQYIEEAGALACSGGAVSNYVAFAAPTQGYFVEINNFSGSTLYLLVFDSATNSLNGRVPHSTAVPIPTGSVGGKNYGVGGAPFAYGVNVCLSQTPFSLTNATAGGTATLIHKGRAR